MKKTCVAGLIGLALCAGSAMHSVYAADAKHPNLVIILADDLGYGEVHRLLCSGAALLTFAGGPVDRPHAVSYGH